MSSIADRAFTALNLRQYKEQVVRRYFNRREYGIYIDGKFVLHDEDNFPCIEWNDGSREYYSNGLLHNVNDAARQYSNGHKEYWINGMKVDKNKFELARSVVSAILLLRKLI
jgi:hypothetical protein